jgi:hypothetical protein
MRVFSPLQVPLALPLNFTALETHSVYCIKKLKRDDVKKPDVRKEQRREIMR